MPRFLALAALLAASSAAAQTPAFDVEATYNAGGPVTHTAFQVNIDGTFIARGFARDVGNTTGCAAFLPATGAGTRFMWLPCRGAVRFGRAPVGPGSTTWDDANMDDFTFAGGHQVIADGYGAFAYGDQVTVTGTVGVGFGSGVSVTGTAGFSSGASNNCSGFACTAIGYTVAATGQGSTALGYRAMAFGDYSTAIGYRAATCSVDPTGAGASLACSGTVRAGAIVISTNIPGTTYVRAQANNEFRLRAIGGIRMRVSESANGNTPGAGGNVGCDLTSAVPTWTCASSRTLKEGFLPVDGEDVLARLRDVPVTTWVMTGDEQRALHLGPVAEDFYAAFGLGIGETTIGMGDIDGVTFAAAQALETRTHVLAGRVQALEAENAALRATQAETDARLARLEALLAPKPPAPDGGAK
jgi:hypothetical protein